jgi:glycerate 2-kinase
LDEALRAADPSSILKEKIKRKDSILILENIKLDLSRFHRVIVIGGGKATAKMAIQLEEILGAFLTRGIVNIPDYTNPKPHSSKIEFHLATHPIPSSKGIRGVEKMLKLVGNPSQDDLVFCLISGGGSSLMPFPIKGITISELDKITGLLLNSGAEIHEINTIRKHLSAIKGGRLAEKLYPARVVSLIISDVAGDNLDFIASGPTVPDSTSYLDAKKILQRYHLWKSIPKLSKLIELGVLGKYPDTPKQGSKLFRRVSNLLIGSNKAACEAASRYLYKAGYNAIVLSTQVQGEAREVAKIFSGILSDMRSNGFPLKTPAAVVAGGETTVTLSGHGLGGRNQELALAVALGISGLRDVTFASMGTDGVDGPTNAAGAIVDGRTIARAKELKMNSNLFLQNHDSHHFFKKLGDLLITGPTGTNVNDVMILLALK